MGREPGITKTVIRLQCTCDIQKEKNESKVEWKIDCTTVLRKFGNLMENLHTKVPHQSSPAYLRNRPAIILDELSH